MARASLNFDIEHERALPGDWQWSPVTADGACRHCPGSLCCSETRAHAARSDGSPWGPTRTDASPPRRRREPGVVRCSGAAPPDSDHAHKVQDCEPGACFAGGKRLLSSHVPSP